MLPRLLRTLWGDLSPEEISKFTLLGITFYFIMAVCWMIIPLKYALFMTMVGKFYLPYGKMVSFVFISLAVLGYSKLVDMMARHKLFYFLCTLFILFFVVIAWSLNSPTIGLANTTPHVSRLLGWIVFIGIETYNSLMIPLFWSFATSTTTITSAKRVFPLLVVGAELGTLTGATCVTFASTLGIYLLFIICTIALCFVPFTIGLFVKKHPQSLTTDTAPKKATGMFEGLRLLISKPYLIGILAITMFADMISVILEYQVACLTHEQYTSAEKITEFFGHFGQGANFLSLALALLGTGFFIRRFGLTFCLVTLPLLVGILLSYVWVYPYLQGLLIGLIITKGLTYSINNPCKEILYIPTSIDIQYKTKSWIDGLGKRFSKAGGATIAALLNTMPTLLFYGPLISLSFVVTWLIAASLVGRTHHNLVRDNKIIE